MDPDDCDCFLLIEYSGMINDAMATGIQRTMSAEHDVAKSTYGLLRWAYSLHGPPEVQRIRRRTRTLTG